MAHKQEKTIQLPIQTLNLGSIPGKEKLRKLMFQFDLDRDDQGRDMYSLVAYPAYKNGDQWEIGPKIPLSAEGTQTVPLPLPLTLGNLELRAGVMEKWLKSGNAVLTFTPRLYEKNAHAAYSVSDGTTVEDANPIPPGNPE